MRFFCGEESCYPRWLSWLGEGSTWYVMALNIQTMGLFAENRRTCAVCGELQAMYCYYIVVG